MSKIIRPMQYSDFADLLLTLKEGQTIEFACSTDVDFPNEIPEPNECTAWYFARILCIPEYQSRFILIDYAGGEEAFAIPLNGYCRSFDMDDKEIVKGMVKTFFKYCLSLGNINDYVFVEMEE